MCTPARCCRKADGGVSEITAKLRPIFESVAMIVASYLLIAFVVAALINGKLMVGGWRNADLPVVALLFAVAATLGAALHCIGSYRVVCREGGDSEVVIGIGRLCWRRAFSTSDVTGVDEVSPLFGYGDEEQRCIDVRLGTKRVRFGRLLASSQRAWMLRTLREAFGVEGSDDDGDPHRG